MAGEDGARDACQVDWRRPEAEQRFASPMTSSEFYISDEDPMYVQRWGAAKDGLPRSCSYSWGRSYRGLLDQSS